MRVGETCPRCRGRITEANGILICDYGHHYFGGSYIPPKFKELTQKEIKRLEREKTKSFESEIPLTITPETSMVELSSG